MRYLGQQLKSRKIVEQVQAARELTVRSHAYARCLRQI